MKRRKFIKNSISAASCLGMGGLSLSACQDNSVKKISILHTNDVHSHIETFSSNHSKFPGLGGVARRANLIEQVRKENPHTFLFDAGDIFQGTPYFNYFGGELEFKMMSRLGYDAATIGNHDFDNGINGLEKQLPHAEFDFLISNYDFKNTILDGRTKDYHIYQSQGLKIGVFGLGIKLDGLVEKGLYKETRYLDPIEIADDMSTFLKTEKECDLIIALSHLGYNYRRNPDKPSDLLLAKKSSNIDLIIGGHTHTFLKKPTVVKNNQGKNMLVNQVGCWGVQLGRIDYIFDQQKNLTVDGTSIIV